jgi:hypothetical protein
MKVLRVNKVTPVSQTDYLRMLGEALVQLDKVSAQVDVVGYQPKIVSELRDIQAAIHTMTRKKELT